MKNDINQIRGACLHAAQAEWIPSVVAALLTHTDERVRTSAEDSVVATAQIIVGIAYYKKLRQLLHPLLPKGIPLPPLEEDGSCPDVRFSEQLLNLCSGEMRRIAEEYAADNALDEAKYITGCWIREQDEAFARESGNEPGNLAPLLSVALAELKDAAIAHQCALVWFRLSRGSGWFSAPAQPTSWRKVAALIRKQPDLVTVGPQEMLKRGLVPPPWFTALVT